MKISLVIGFDSLSILYLVSTWKASQGAKFGGNPSVEFFGENLQNLLAKIIYQSRRSLSLSSRKRPIEAENYV